MYTINPEILILGIYPKGRDWQALKKMLLIGKFILGLLNNRL